MLLIVDFDGTLADTMTRTQVEELRGLETRAVFEMPGIGERRLPAIVAELRARAAAMANGFRLFDGVAGLIEALHRRGDTAMEPKSRFNTASSAAGRGQGRPIARRTEMRSAQNRASEREQW